ncbi:hypothetical protein GUJ93_ZPchr0009g1971 [Zizania palustris]|uniref:Uncharacterized protein n=1 Tax=Zizania palustris TaxID=103762 RepID=A0A8J5R920_ZIZPA|nr:hypothetical protein GUJ93_ZPchr0009g1971 [Zizania palustris]
MPSPSPYVVAVVNLPGLVVMGWVFAGGGGTGLLGSLVKEDGHVYSLAAAGDLLYTGTDSKNVRVWRDRREFAGFRSGSGLVKAIVVSSDGRFYTGHQDGKVRVWRASADDPAVHMRVGSLPGLRDLLRSAVKPSHYVATRRRHSAMWLRHFDAVSCLSMDAGAGCSTPGRGTRRSRCGACRTRGASSRCKPTTTPSTRGRRRVRRVGVHRLGGRHSQGVASGAREGRRHEACHGAGAAQGESAVTAISVAAEARVVYVLGRRRNPLAVAARRGSRRRTEERRDATRAQDGRALPRGDRSRRRKRLRRPDDLRVAARGGRQPRPPRRAHRPYGSGQVRGHGRGGRHGRRRPPALGGVQRQPRRVRQGVARRRRPNSTALTPAHA